MNDTQGENLKRYFNDGYKKGYHDAIIGVTMKLLQHTLQLSSAYMQQWEQGYKNGYADALKELKEPQNNTKTSSAVDS